MYATLCLLSPLWSFCHYHVPFPKIRGKKYGQGLIHTLICVPYHMLCLSYKEIKMTSLIIISKSIVYCISTIQVKSQ